MKKIYIKEDTSINWFNEYHVHALNMTTKTFDVVNDICGDDNLLINIINDLNDCVEEEKNISKQIQEIESTSCNTIEFLLYYKHFLVGYVEKIDVFGL